MYGGYAIKHILQNTSLLSKSDYDTLKINGEVSERSVLRDA